MAAFALGISPAGSSQQDDLTFFYAKFPDPHSNSQDDYLFADISVNKSGMVEIVASPAKTSLSSMLNKLGVPSQIWINIVTIGPGPMEYTLALFYEKGVMVVYQGTTNSGDINFINICPKDIPKRNSQLWVWNSVTIQTFEDIGKISTLIAPLSPNRFQLLNEVSDMQPQVFFDYYIDPSATQCIKTHASAWFK